MHASLVSIGDDRAGQPRVTMLQTVVEFARGRLGAGDVDGVRHRHALHYLEVARRFGPHFHGLGSGRRNSGLSRRATI